MFHVKHLKLHFRAEAWGTGTGDFLQLMAAVPEWQRRNPGAPVTIAYQRVRNTPAYMHFPGVTYREVEWLDEADYIDVMLHRYDPPRCTLFEDLGLDWADKRFYYPLTEQEAHYARNVWAGRPRPWITLQTGGGMFCKRWPALASMPEVLEEQTKGTVIVLDWAQQYRGRCLRVGGAADLRLVLALASTSDLFMGWDSGPFYAAIGRLVPAVGLFPVRAAEMLYWPVREPSTIIMQGPVRAYEPRDFMGSALKLLEATFDADRPSKSLCSGWVDR